jgi:uncharacterized protein involved in exopolysaccharide biosynthesis
MTTLAPPILKKLPLDPRRWGRYVVVSIGANFLIWAAALGYLKVAKVIYTCEWSLILPGAGAGSNLSLENIGSVASSVSSPFGGSSSIDPKSNYKAIAESFTVRATAAKKVHLSVEEFGEAKIKSVDQTSVMQFAITGSTRKQAQQKAIALNEALAERIDQLRFDEIVRRENGFKRAIADGRKKLEQAQRALLVYKTKTGITSSNQSQDLATIVGALRKDQVEVLAQRNRASRRRQQLGQNLKLTPQEAVDAFTLQVDPLFLQSMKEYNEAESSLTIYRSKWGENHPEVIKEAARQRVTRDALIRQSQTLLRRRVDEKTLQRLNAGSGNRASLMQDLVTSKAEEEGLTGQNQELTEQMSKFKKELSTLSRQQATLESLQRDLQIAEAVFSSTLGKIDVGKTDIFASYPLVQSLIEPGLPEVPSGPKKSLVLVGSAASSFVTTAGLILLWLRQKKKNSK